MIMTVNLYCGKRVWKSQFYPKFYMEKLCSDYKNKKVVFIKVTTFLFKPYFLIIKSKRKYIYEIN